MSEVSEGIDNQAKQRLTLGDVNLKQNVMKVENVEINCL